MVVGQGERLARGDQHQAVGALRQQGADLLRVVGVVEDDGDRQPGQMLVVQLAEPFDLLVGGGALAEEQLLARGAEPVQQMQQGVPGGQRRLVAAVAAQVHHAGAAELVLQIMGRPHRERRTATAGRPVQHHDRGPGLGARAGCLYPLPDPPQLLPPPGEHPGRFGELAERLLQDGAPARRRALVGAAQRRGRPRRRAQHPLLVEEGPDAAYLQRGQPGQPQLLGPARLSDRPGLVVRGRQMGPGHLHHGRHGADHPGGHARAHRRTHTGAERQVGDRGGDPRDARHQQRSAAAVAGVALAEGEPAGLCLVQRAGVRLVLLGRGLRHGVQRAPRPGQQYVPVGASARAAHLLLHGPSQQPLGLCPMAVPHVTSPSGGNGILGQVCCGRDAVGRGPEDRARGVCCAVRAQVLRQDGPHAEPTGP